MGLIVFKDDIFIKVGMSIPTRLKIVVGHIMRAVISGKKTLQN